ncbi:unnamed protein product [Paramecium sonneborni]|uniref:Uncharacterized protein n=1 Tax=Paramecium sonneborni TaxID=65129 RepID=A0A8S1R3R4_9CILI|nr:unnamed protein product [Paramecium sonneborni]
MNLQRNKVYQKQRLIMIHYKQNLKIVNWDIIKEIDFSGNYNYGLDHGMRGVYSEKLKKSLGIEVQNQELIERIRNGNVFIISKSEEKKLQIILYRLTAYLFSSWDSKEAKVSEARIETL